MTIFEKMQTDRSFSETEKQILHYLIENEDKLVTLTIRELADYTFSSNATIIRLCHKLGFSGYRDFRIAFAQELGNRKLITQTIDYSQPFQKGESAQVIMQNIYSLFKECLDITQANLDVHVLQQIVRIMNASRRTFLFGRGDTKLTIRSFINKCIKINFFPILATENQGEYYVCQNMNSSDCALFVSYSGKHKDFDRYVSVLRRKGVKVIALTGNQESFLAKHSDFCICVSDLEKEAKIATFYSQLIFQYILDLLFSLIYQECSSKEKQ